MHDEDRGERMAGGRGQRELGIWRAGKEAVCIKSKSAVVDSGALGASVLPWMLSRTGVVADHWPLAIVAIAVTKGAEANTAVGSKWDALDDGRGYGGQEKQGESSEEEYRQGRGRAQHVGEEGRALAKSSLSRGDRSCSCCAKVEETSAREAGARRLRSDS